MSNLKVVKFQETMGSKNFFVSLTTLILLVLEANGLGIDATGGEIVDAISSQDIGAIISVVVLNLLNPITKLLQQGVNWSWAFLKSMNFWTQAVTTVLVGVTLAGITFPESAANSIVEAVFSNEFNAIGTTIVINILNPLYHFFFDKPKEEEPPVVEETAIRA
jgi:hypothetical protein